jgi:hypothetical protein
MAGGVYKIGLPRSDLHVTLDGVQLKPALALGSWLAFVSHGAGEASVMGDLVLTDAEVNPVMAKLVEGRIEITALHNHLLRNSPHTCTCTSAAVVIQQSWQNCCTMRWP